MYIIMNNYFVIIYVDIVQSRLYLYIHISLIFFYLLIKIMLQIFGDINWLEKRFSQHVWVNQQKIYHFYSFMSAQRFS